MNQEQTGIRQSVKAARKNRPFIFGLVIFLFTWVTISIIQLILLYYVKYVVRREAQSDLIMATIFVVAMLSLPVWEWVSHRLNKRLAYIAGIAFLIAVLLTLIFSRREHTPGAAPGLVRTGRNWRGICARPALVHHPGCDRIW